MTRSHERPGRAATLRRILADAVRFDRTGVTVGFGVRCTIGVALPLVMAAAAGAPLLGVSAAYGALVAGYASRQGVYRTRAAAMLIGTAALAVAGFTGVISGPYPAVSAVVIALWCLAFGLIASLGIPAMTVSFNSIVALLLFSNPPYDGSDPFQQAGAIVAGGALQTALLILVWPLQRFRAEREALARVYDALGTYAAGVQSDDLGMPDSGSLAALGSALADPQPFGSRGEIAAFQVLADEAERVRGSLAALATDAHLLAEVGLTSRADAIARACLAAAPILCALGPTLRAERLSALDPGAWTALEDAVVSLERGAAAGTADVSDARAFAGQVRSAWRAAAVVVRGGLAVVPAHESEPLFDVHIVTGALDTLRANCTWRSTYARHAIRLSAGVTAAVALQHALPLAHGQWIGLTVALVLRPDFSSTFTRGVARVAGTIAGAILAGAIAFAHPSELGDMGLAIAFALLGFTLFNVSYALFSATITGYVVFLLAFGGLPENAAAFDRVLATAAGGVLALAIYAVWPDWSRERIAADLAALIDAQRTFVRNVLAAYLDPAAHDDAGIRTARSAAWLARSNAEASIDRMAGEPVRARSLSVRSARGIIAETRRFGVAALALDARASRTGPAPAAPLATLRDDLDAALGHLVAALRAGVVPEALPPLRDDQIALVRALHATPGTPLDVLASETDMLVDSVNTIAAILTRR